MSLDDTPPAGIPVIDWRSVAARVAMADGAFYLLTSVERDALEVAVDFQRISEAERDPSWVVEDAFRQGAQLAEQVHTVRHAFWNAFGDPRRAGDPNHGNSGPGGPLPGER